MDFFRNLNLSGAKPADAAAESAGAVPAADVIKAGILRKQGGSIKSWKERWFTLTAENLAYYKVAGDKEPIDAIPLNKIRVCQREETSDPRNAAGFAHHFSVDVANRVYVIGARTEAERNEWVDAINNLIRDLPKDFGAPALPPKDELRASVDNVVAVGVPASSAVRLSPPAGWGPRVGLGWARSFSKKKSACVFKGRGRGRAVALLRWGRTACCMAQGA